MKQNEHIPEPEDKNLQQEVNEPESQNTDILQDDMPDDIGTRRNNWFAFLMPVVVVLVAIGLWLMDAADKKIHDNHTEKQKTESVDSAAKNIPPAASKDISSKDSQ